MQGDTAPARDCLARLESSARASALHTGARGGPQLALLYWRLRCVHPRETSHDEAHMTHSMQLVKTHSIQH
jgi:hypothetical protein